MKRVRVEALPIVEAALSSEASHHLLHVLRARPGRALLLFDGRGLEQPAELVDTRGGLAFVRSTGESRATPPQTRAELVLAVLKHQPMDRALRMATEAGVTAIHPVLTERVTARGDRRERWLRIVSSAAAQCGRANEPVLHAVRPLRDVVPELEGPVYVGMPDADDGIQPGPGAVIVGPAGGFAPPEQTWLRSHAIPVRLGPHVLRAETATVVAIAGLVRPSPPA